METKEITAKFEKYPEYKDSGVEWIGQIPKDWDAVRMNYLFKDISIKNKSGETLLSVTQDQGVIPREWVGNRVVMPSGNLESFKFIRKGDFAISLRSFEGGLEYCHHNGIISPAYTVLEKNDDLYEGYYKYLFKSFSFIQELQTCIVGIREGKNISYSILSYSHLPIPNFNEQTAIANFLDKKTQKIDQAISSKEKLISLLQERKQIVIQNAVTRGLNPNVKFKDSGIEWIGQIPEHWEVKKLKYVASINELSLPENTNKKFKLKYVDIGSVSFETGIGKIDFVDFKNAPSRARRLAEEGNTIISTVRTYLKAIDYISKEKSQYVYSTGFAVLKPLLDNNKFLFHFVRSNAFTEQVTFNSKGMSYPAINSTDLSEMSIAIPSKIEQVKIVNYIENQFFKIDQIISKQHTLITKLKEYKQTLIDSAVTGKIKIN